MTEKDRRLRDLLEAAAGEPPHRVSAEAVRRRVSRRRARECLAGAAAVAVIAVLVPLGAGAAGHAPGPAGRHRPPAGPAVYVAYGIAHGISKDTPVVIPISTATNRAGQPINLGHSRGYGPDFIAITPDGRTAYVASLAFDTVTPIDTATNNPGQPIRVGPAPVWVAITPDGKTAYVLGSSGGNRNGAVVTPVSTATNTPGQPIYLHGAGGVGLIAITPDGKTAYIACEGAVVPISTETNTPGQPIRLALGYPMGIAITGP